MKLQGILITDKIYEASELTIENGNITQIDTINSKSNLPFIIPSFVDLHNHGGAGEDFMNTTEEGLHKVAAMHKSKGTGYMLATTMTDKHENLLKAFKVIEKIINKPKEDEACIFGIHLEGPYISEKKLGAQPKETRALNINEIMELHSISPIKIITLSPETLLDIKDINKLINLGIRVQIGHSNATYEEALTAMNQGASSFTHLYNAMTPLLHRSPNLVGAALAHAENAEIIPDLLHIHPGAIKVATRAIPKMYAVTDATAATGMPDGEYKLGLQTVHKCANGVRLADGSLAGSCLTMIEAFKNLHKIGYSLTDCVKLTSTNAKNYIGLNHGIQIGLKASLLVLNYTTLDIERVV